MRAGALNSEVYPVRTYMTDTKQIPNSDVCSTHDGKLKEFLVDKTLLQICSTDTDGSKGISVNEYYMDIFRVKN